MLSSSIVERFWHHVLQTETCWLWTGSLSGKGYGRFWYKGATISAHRMSWLIHFSDPGKLFVLHKRECKNRRCVRPTHLYLGTHAENMNDLIAAGSLSGSNNPRAILTPENVEEIRRRYIAYSRGPNSQPALAREFGVAHSTIGRIVNDLTWSRVDKGEVSARIERCTTHG